MTKNHCRAALVILAAALGFPSVLALAAPEDDWAALSGAAGKGDLKTVEAMLKKGVKPDTAHPGHLTTLSPMDDAAVGNNIDLVRLLLKYHADINAHENVGDYTPLMFAAENGEFEVAQELIRRGAKLNLKDKSGATALDHAIRTKDAAHQKVAALLKQHGGAAGTRPAAQAAQATANADPCGGIVELADMGPKGYAAVAGAPLPQDSFEGMMGDKAAKMALGPSLCTVDDDDGEFSCAWKGEISYAELVSTVKQCLKPKTTKVSDQGGKSTIWYGGQDDHTMVEMYEKGPSIKFVGTSPHHLKPTFEVQNWTNDTIRVALDGSERCTIKPQAVADGYAIGSNCNLDIAQGTYTLAVTKPGGAILQQVFTYNGSNCAKVLDGGLSFKDGLNCVFAPGKDKE